VIDIVDLGRRPGSTMTADRTVPAPEHLGIDVIGVPEGTDLQLQLQLESVEEGVLVSGRAQAHLVGECVRCLDPVERDISFALQDLYFYDDLELEGDDGELRRLAGDTFDLEPLVRDTLVPVLPLAPLCRVGCPGLCSECGAHLADDPDHGHEILDTRWAALLDVSTTTSSETSTSTDSSTASPHTEATGPDETKVG